MVLFSIVDGVLVVFMVRLKALVVFPNDRAGDFGDLLAIGRAEAKRILRTRDNVNVIDILYSAKCGVHVIIFEVPESARVEAKPLVVGGGSLRGN
ncbi:hypothetical protein MCGE09_00570 [Thaumarchaeota archaeon SCGC AB-539-E09]|nr:hypothetical protein MCGE09_00570 [Thaumarchaeota archaeon SCGC AB-539-E09]